MKRCGSWLLLIVLALAMLPVPTQAQTASGFGRFHAVVIGNKNYKHLPILQTPLLDADEVAKVLKEQYGFTIDPLQDATRGEMMAVLYKLRNTMTERDNLLIYYAGHGEFDDAIKMGYWQPIDAEEENLDKWISIDDINSQIKAIRARHVLVVADSCYSGTLMRNSGSQLLKGELQDDYLRRMQERPSRTALTSGGNERVADGGGNGHSVFAEVFITVLRNNQNFLTGTQLFNKINEPVTNHAEQTPYYGEIKSAYPLADDIENKGDFVFVSKRLQGGTATENEPQQPIDLKFLERGNNYEALQQLKRQELKRLREEIKDLNISIRRLKVIVYGYNIETVANNKSQDIEEPGVISQQKLLQQKLYLEQERKWLINHLDLMQNKTIGQYIDHGDGTVTDTKTGLMWKRCQEGLSGVNCEEGKLKKYSWNEAVQDFKNVEYADYKDWRLPTIDELTTLVYCSKGRDKDKNVCNRWSESPTINQQAFPNTAAWFVWSGSPYADDSDGAWFVYFDYGLSNFDIRVSNFAVRLVRGGQ